MLSYDRLNKNCNWKLSKMILLMQNMIRICEITLSLSQIGFFFFFVQRNFKVFPDDRMNECNIDNYFESWINNPSNGFDGAFENIFRSRLGANGFYAARVYRSREVFVQTWKIHWRAGGSWAQHGLLIEFNIEVSLDFHSLFEQALVTISHLRLLLPRFHLVVKGDEFARANTVPCSDIHMEQLLDIWRSNRTLTNDRLNPLTLCLLHPALDLRKKKWKNVKNQPSCLKKSTNKQKSLNSECSDD